MAGIIHLKSHPHLCAQFIPEFDPNWMQQIAASALPCLGSVLENKETTIGRQSSNIGKGVMSRQVRIEYEGAILGQNRLTPFSNFRLGTIWYHFDTRLMIFGRVLDRRYFSAEGWLYIGGVFF